MNVLLGIGNSDKGDDGVGPLVASLVQDPDWLCINAGTAPENTTGLVRRAEPELLLLVDASEMGLPAGTLRRIPPSRIEDVGIGTHMLPLRHVIDYLGRELPTIMVVGIQPQSLIFGAPISPPVQAAADTLVDCIRRRALDTIPLLGAEPPPPTPQTAI